HGSRALGLAHQEFPGVMSESAGHPGKVNFLPTSAREFLQRRVVEGAGVALGAAALALLLAMVTFSADDPSLNKAVSEPARNLMGTTGAYAADVALQGLGLACLMLVAVMLAWSSRLVRHRRLPHWWLKLILLPPALAGLATAIATLPAPASWPAILGCGLGGCTGLQIRALVSQSTG